MHDRMRLLLDFDREVWLFWVMAFGDDDRFLPFLMTVSQLSLSMLLEWQVRIYPDVKSGVKNISPSDECKTKSAICELRG